VVLFAVGLFFVCRYLSDQDSWRCVESISLQLSEAVVFELSLSVRGKTRFLQQSTSEAALGQTREVQGSVVSRAKWIQMSEPLGLETSVTACVRSVLRLSALFI